MRASGSGAFAIGRRADGYASGYFRGLVDEVAVYDRALPVERVQSHVKDPAAGLVRRWAFDDAVPAADERLKAVQSRVGPRAGVEQP